jgi:hypothetical protein
MQHSYLHPQARSQHTPAADQLGHHPCDCVNGDGKAHASRCARWREDGGVEPNQAATAVQQRASAVACRQRQRQQAGNRRVRGHTSVSALTRQKPGACAHLSGEDLLRRMHLPNFEAVEAHGSSTQQNKQPGLPVTASHLPGCSP